MRIYAYAADGYAGSLVSVEVDIRRGMPGLDIVGLPDGAVRESRDRVRVALKRSGFDFPAQRILVNLAPAGLRKEGASYDLAIAVGILSASGQLDSQEESILCAGELRLDGSLRPVHGILSAAAGSIENGIPRFIVPEENLIEASALPGTEPVGIGHLRQIPGLLSGKWPESGLKGYSSPASDSFSPLQEMADIRGQGVLRRALEIAAAGRHHLLIFGPPGSGKTMAARALAGIVPNLSPEASLEATRIWSQAGRLGENAGLIKEAPFREPHHTSTAEGLIGGGSGSCPGEASLAHRGILFLDEAPEFGARTLQTLREPLESRKVAMARAGRTWWYPAEFQLILAMNPCPCGMLGKEESSCICTATEIGRHWRRLGAALLDRVDIRVPVSPVGAETLLDSPGEKSLDVRMRVTKARRIQEHRYLKTEWNHNAGIKPGVMNTIVELGADSRHFLSEAVRAFGLSSRAVHGILRVARTIADLDGRSTVTADDILEAVQHRRFGDRDLFWTSL